MIFLYYILLNRGDTLEKKIAIVLGVIVAVFILNVVTKGAAWPFLVIGVMGYLIYKNNR